jgi:SAM-dependent methyltransferase
MIASERIKQGYERRPYPGPTTGDSTAESGSMPAGKWMQAVGRPGASDPQRVLVAGCGTGQEALVLRRAWPNAEIVAVDFSPRSIAVARRLQRTSGAGRPIDFRVADLTAPDLAARTGGEFDLITCHGVLSYIPDSGSALRHLSECGRPDGALYLGVNGEGHPATRLRPWLASFGLAVDDLRNEARLRVLLRLWDSLHDDDLGELATMSASYLSSDICGAHFNNWPLARWRAEARRCGWEVASTGVLPLGQRLAMEGNNDLPLFPGGPGEIAERLDQARPAGFHRLLLRKSAEGALDLPTDPKDWTRLSWTGFYTARFSKPRRSSGVKIALHCPTLQLRAEWTVTSRQAEALRAWIAVGTLPDHSVKLWAQSATARRMLWLWVGLGVVAVKAEPAVGSSH